MGYELYQLFRPNGEDTKVFGLLSTIAMYVVVIGLEPEVRAKMQEMGLNPDLWFKEPIKINYPDWNTFMEAIKT